MKRLSIYFYWNVKGWVGDYVPYYLKKISEYCEDACVVVNEPLSHEGRKILKDCCDVLLVRENIGFDSSAYKYALEYYGYEKLKEYDEVILHNFTHYGPIYPLSELFGEMGKRECDFWGINRHPEQNAYLGQGAKAKIVEHIQSYFLVIRKKILQDPSFKNYWDTLEVATNYNEAIIFHELRFTSYFEKKGFISSSYMDFRKYSKNKLNSSVLQPDEQHIKDRNPFIKRKVFFIDNEQWFQDFIGHTAREVLDHIDKYTDYDINLIWQDLLATQKMSVLRNNLHLNYYLSTENNKCKITNKVALILFVYYEDLVDYCLKYAQSMPKDSDIYVISSKNGLLKTYQEALNEIGYNVICRKSENRGRDVSAYLVAAADVYAKYDYICCMHDKKTKHLFFPLQGEEFAYHCFENNLATSGFVANVVRTFNDNPKLGMLVPPAVNFGPLRTLGQELGVDRQGIKVLYDKLELEIPFDDHPVAPFGTMFWVRGRAFNSMFKYKWKYSDFPCEPINTDGTILHAIERVYPLAVQNEGYYVGWLATEYYANVYLDNLAYGIQHVKAVVRYVMPDSQYKIIRKGLRLQYLRYKLMSKITFGKARKRYKKKRDKVKMMLKSM